MDDMRCKISVIMPVYNASSYLNEAIESFLRQSIREKELICIDDGSSDNSVKIIESYEFSYEEVKLIKLGKNIGAGRARNYGLDKACGEYVCFLDADDFYLDTEALEKLYFYSDKYNLDACAGLINFYHDGVYEKNPQFRDIVNSENVFRNLKFSEKPVDYGYTSFIFRRRFIDEKEIRFPDLKRYQDPPFLMESLYYSQHYGAVNVEMYAYRVGYKSLNYSVQSFNDMLRGFYTMIKFADTHDNTEFLIKKILSRIDTNYLHTIVSELRSDNPQALDIILKINAVAIKYGYNLGILRYLVYFNRNRTDEDFFEYSAYEFMRVHNLFEKKLAIYGAGQIGEGLVRSIETNHSAQIGIWVDQNKSGKEYFGQRVGNIDLLDDGQWDKLIIAIYDKKTSAFVRNLLKKKGINNENIIEWSDSYGVWNVYPWYI